MIRGDDGAAWLAHRASWVLANGPIPDGLSVCHRCDTPLCVRPDHLFLGTHADNIRDAVKKGRVILPVKKARGEQHPRARLTVSQVLLIRRLHGTVSNLSLAARFKINPATVCNIVKRRIWKHV